MKKITIILMAISMMFVSCYTTSNPSDPSNPFNPIYKTNTVTFNTNGGSSVDSIVLYEGDMITEVPTSEREDYSFAYWYLDDENVPFDFTSSVETDIILNARWYKTWFLIEEGEDFTTFDYWDVNIETNDNHKCAIHYKSEYINKDFGITIKSSTNNEIYTYEILKKADENKKIEAIMKYGYRNILDVNRIGNEVFITTVHN
jgi:hypothetical protein